MSNGARHNLAMGQAMGDELVRLLAPHCQPGYCQIAGSIRRRKPTFGDIEIVCLPWAIRAALRLAGSSLCLEKIE